MVQLSRFKSYFNLPLENKGQGLTVRKYASKDSKRNLTKCRDLATDENQRQNQTKFI